MSAPDRAGTPGGSGTTETAGQAALLADLEEKFRVTAKSVGRCRNNGTCTSCDTEVGRLMKLVEAYAAHAAIAAAAPAPAGDGGAVSSPLIAVTAPAHELDGLGDLIAAAAGLPEPLRITVRGKPAPQGSKTALRGPNGRVNLVESSKGVAGWREAVRAETQRSCAAPIDGPVTVTLEFWMTRPRSHYRTGKNSHLLKPDAPRWPCSPARDDIDKLSRAVLDGLTMGGAWHGDGQVVTLTASKGYRYDQMTGVTITVRDLTRAGAYADAHANEQNQTSEGTS